MAAARFIITTTFTTGSTMYAVIWNLATGQVWDTTLNTGAGGWATYNSANWANYAVALTEKTSSGFYTAAYPAAIGAVLTKEQFFQQAGGSPLITDAPSGDTSQSQGQNVAAVSGDPQAADNQGAAALSMQIGQAAGSPTASVIPTDLSSTLVGNYAGRSIIFTSGAAYQCVGRIVGYAADGTITLAAPLAVAPAADDDFIIV